MLTEVDKARLKNVRDDLRVNPTPFNMSDWNICIAGRISKFETGGYSPTLIAEMASLSPLFGIGHWPSDLTHRYVKASVRSIIPSKEKPALIAAEAIDRFLEADGNELAFQTPRIHAMIPKARALEAKATVAAATIGTTLGLLMTFLVR